MKSGSKSKSKINLTYIFIGIILFSLGWIAYSKMHNYNVFYVGSVKGASIVAADLNESSLSASPELNISISTTPSQTIITSTTEPTKRIESEEKKSDEEEKEDNKEDLDTSNQVFYGTNTPNNKVGMYVHNNADDIKQAAKLINSNGGKWGYVLLTMEIGDRSKSNWQKLLDAAGSSKLIPIIQLFNGSNCNPDKMDFKGLAETLNSLKWPTSHRYISVFNEINAKDYWCQRLAPEEYAKALNSAIKEFKSKSSSFFIMPGAFNSSARTQDRYLSEDTYLIRMNNAVPGIFKKIDGWATHSYPQPNFSGDINNLPAGYSARDTINNYTWEMDILKNNFGINGLPIFITETGWLHKEGQNGCFQYSQSNLLSQTTVAARFKDTFLNYWMADKRVVAITPFIFKSEDPCASGFAWQKQDGSWYPQATMLMEIPKTSGTP